MRHFFLSLIVPVLATAACNGQVVLGDVPSDGGATKDSAVLEGDASPKQPDSGPVADASVADASVAPACAPDGIRHAFTSIADVAAQLQGRWLLCSGGINEPAGTVGIEFAGSTAYFLQRQGGAVVRVATSDFTRTVQILDTSSMNGPGAYQINLSTSAFFNTYIADTYTTGVKMRLNEGTSGKVAEYVLESPRPACTLAGGRWDVTSNSFYGTDASFEFAADGTFIGGPRAAALPGGSIYSGAWSVINGTFTVGPTTGMQCDAYQTNMALTFDAACTTATLVTTTDGCTGGRKYFEATTVLGKR